LIDGDSYSIILTDLLNMREGWKDPFMYGQTHRYISIVFFFIVGMQFIFPIKNWIFPKNS